MYISIWSFTFSITLSLCLCSLEVTVTSLHPPRLCRNAVLSIKPTFLSRCPSVCEPRSYGHFTSSTPSMSPRGIFNKTHLSLQRYTLQRYTWSEPPPDVADVSLDVALYSLLYFFVLSACACGPEVTVTVSSPITTTSTQIVIRRSYGHITTSSTQIVIRRLKC